MCVWQICVVLPALVAIISAYVYVPTHANSAQTPGIKSPLQPSEASTEFGNAETLSLKSDKTILTASQEICRDFLRSACKREEKLCRFVHRMPTEIDINQHQAKQQLHRSIAQSVQLDSLGCLRSLGSLGSRDQLTVCIDFLRGRCQRSIKKCR